GLGVEPGVVGPLREGEPARDVVLGQLRRLLLVGLERRAALRDALDPGQWNAHASGPRLDHDRGGRPLDHDARDLAPSLEEHLVRSDRDGEDERAGKSGQHRALHRALQFTAPEAPGHASPAPAGRVYFWTGFVLECAFTAAIFVAACGSPLSLTR